MPRISRDRFARIELLLLDVDGVLTDGTLIYSAQGDELKAFHVRDGSGIKFWRQSGKRVAILSGRTSETVRRRAQEAGIDLVIQGESDKLPALRRILSDTGLQIDQVCAVGDDLPDLPVLLHCGLAVAVADAAPELKTVAHYTTDLPGGRGAVREAIEWLMRGQKTWDSAVETLREQPFPPG
jgi:3-deoxy-D-manno-octulosonate 8-phosphate phosphatase (KDO 8-P phosphatase)